MKTFKNFAFGLLLSTWAAAAVFAQAESGEQLPSPDAPTVTVSASVEGVRFVTLGGVRQMRLEVFGEAGDSLYSSGFKAGNVLEWNMGDVRGQRLPDASYLCVVTVRDLSGRLFVKQGDVLVQNGRASLQMSEAGRAETAAPEKGLAPVTADAPPAVTLTAHDGTDGQIVTTRGGLSFRAGDFFAGRDKELMRLTPSGDVGVGVTTPTARLDVAGTIRARGGIRFDDGTVLKSLNDLKAAADAGLNVAGAGTLNIAGTGTANKLAKWTDNAGTLGDSLLTESNGNLGFGTATPLGRLHISAAGGFGNENADGTSQANAVPLIIQSDMTVLGFLNGNGRQAFAVNLDNNLGTTNARGVVTFYDKYDGQWHSSLTLKNGSVGFGTNAPLGKLHIKAAGAFTTENSDGTSQVNTVPLLMQSDGTVLGFLNGNGRQAFAINLDSNAGTTSARGVVTFYDKYDGNWHASMTLKNGNVGVGTAAPASKLDVAGSVKVSGDVDVTGNIAAKYQDVAEWVPARHSMDAGTVVVLDVSRSNTVMPSGRAYDTHVAGIVSPRPGLILGEAGESKVLVATTGRVKVRVDATRRPVRVGDLLVTSGKPGVAMRSLPISVGGTRIHRPGTIIGKALEPLKNGEGEILVLLSLQ